MQTHRVLGIMSGTSADGVDYALCALTKTSAKLIKLWSHPFPAKLRERILKAAHNELTSFETAQLDHDLGRFYAEKAPRVKFDYIGLHGQTIFHNPTKKTGATYQIGDPSYLITKFNVPVIHQFRNIDLALGGQGAPLATLFHREVFSDYKLNVAVNNLGGISNVTYLPKNSKGILSFDTGPANMLVDLAIALKTKNKKSFDEGGTYARRGVADQGLIEEWMKHPFFKIKPPKSTGREDFGSHYFKRVWVQCDRKKLSFEDRIATLTSFTAQSLAQCYVKFLRDFPERVILCGGGAYNPTLVNSITKELRKAQWEKEGKNIKNVVEVVTSESLGWPAQSIEAAAFALLAYRTMNKLPGNIPATTGARREAVLGQIVPAL